MTRLQAVPVVERFETQIVIMEEPSEPQKFRSRWLNAEGIPTCPACGCHEFSVRDSEKWKNGAKERYRACKDCGLPAKTEETFVE